MSYRPPHNNTWLQIIPLPKGGVIPIWHDENVPDTTFYVSFYKVVDDDTLRNELVVNSETFYRYNVGDKIEFEK